MDDKYDAAWKQVTLDETLNKKYPGSKLDDTDFVTERTKIVNNYRSSGETYIKYVDYEWIQFKDYIKNKRVNPDDF